MKKEQIRCKHCDRRLFDGSPGWDIISKNPKVLRIKCSKCGNINLVSTKLFEKVIVRLEKRQDENKELKDKKE